MIDSHCHLEQDDYSKDREKVIKRAEKELKAVITSCAHPRDLDLTLELVEKHKNFVFATIGIHPQYVKEISDGEKNDFLDRIRREKDKIVGIGEVGLDFNWVKEPEWRNKQREWFRDFIRLAKELSLPLIIHSRDAHEDTMKILEEEDAKNVLLHMWGDHHFVDKIVEKGWFVSMNTIILKSKSYRKVIKNIPLERLMLETDAPWLGFGERNEPIAVKKVAEKIADLKKIDFEKVWKTCGKNSVDFFKLSI